MLQDDGGESVCTADPSLTKTQRSNLKKRQKAAQVAAASGSRTEALVEDKVQMEERFDNRLEIEVGMVEALIDQRLKTLMQTLRLEVIANVDHRVEQGLIHHKVGHMQGQLEVWKRRYSRYWNGKINWRLILVGTWIRYVGR